MNAAFRAWVEALTPWSVFWSQTVRVTLPTVAGSVETGPLCVASAAGAELPPGAQAVAVPRHTAASTTPARARFGLVCVMPAPGMSYAPWRRRWVRRPGRLGPGPGNARMSPQVDGGWRGPGVRTDPAAPGPVELVRAARRPPRQQPEEVRGGGCATRARRVGRRDPGSRNPDYLTGDVAGAARHPYPPDKRCPTGGIAVITAGWPPVFRHCDSVWDDRSRHPRHDHERRPRRVETYRRAGGKVTTV